MNPTMKSADLFVDAGFGLGIDRVWYCDTADGGEILVRHDRGGRQFVATTLSANGVEREIARSRTATGIIAALSSRMPAA